MSRDTPYSKEISFSLPHDAPSTMKRVPNPAFLIGIGELKASLEWQMTVSLDVVNFRDIHYIGEIVVLAWRRPSPPSVRP